MWEEILNIVISNGIFATLFVFLLLYLLKDSSKREAKYNNTISALNRNLNVVEKIEEKVDEVKIELNKAGDNIEIVKLDVKTINDKIDQANVSIRSIGTNVKGHSKIIKKVSSDVKIVKDDVTEMKKLIFPKKEEVIDEGQNKNLQLLG
jgi:methyl-accepting chemotaxis protein